MAVNDHTKGVKGKYVGIYAAMSEATNENNNLNAYINAINNLIEDSLMLSAVGIEGRLDTQATLQNIRVTSVELWKV